MSVLRYRCECGRWVGTDSFIGSVVCCPFCGSISGEWIDIAAEEAKRGIGETNMKLDRATLEQYSTALSAESQRLWTLLEGSERRHQELKHRFEAICKTIDAIKLALQHWPEDMPTIISREMVEGDKGPHWERRKT